MGPLLIVGVHRHHCYLESAHQSIKPSCSPATDVLVCFIKKMPIKIFGSPSKIFKTLKNPRARWEYWEPRYKEETPAYIFQKYQENLATLILYRPQIRFHRWKNTKVGTFSPLTPCFPLPDCVLEVDFGLSLPDYIQKRSLGSFYNIIME